MSTLDERFEILREACDAGADAPAGLVGKVDPDETYRLQARMLAYRIARGARHCGWKIGQTNTVLRAERGEANPAPGYLLETDRMPDGTVVDLQGADNWFLEPELAVRLGAALEGAEITPEQARASIECVAPAYELIRPHPGWPDRWLQRAVNGSTAGFVLGDWRAGCPGRQTLDDMNVQLARDGEQTHAVRAGDVNDNPLDSVAWLAGFLAPLGHRLEAGQVVLTGTYCGLVPMAPGQRWESELAGIGRVTLVTC